MASVLLTLVLKIQQYMWLCGLKILRILFGIYELVHKPSRRVDCSFYGTLELSRADDSRFYLIHVSDCGFLSGIMVTGSDCNTGNHAEFVYLEVVKELYLAHIKGVQVRGTSILDGLDVPNSRNLTIHMVKLSDPAKLPLPVVSVRALIHPR